MFFQKLIVGMLRASTSRQAPEPHLPPLSADLLACP